MKKKKAGGHASARTGFVAKSAAGITCVLKEAREHCIWKSLVGLWHDVRIWDADPQYAGRLARATAHLAGRPFPALAQRASLGANEYWIAEALAPHIDGLAGPGPLKGFELQIPATARAADALEATLWARHGTTIKEVVVMRHMCEDLSGMCSSSTVPTAPVVLVFNVVAHGRRFYRTLVWASDARFSYADSGARSAPCVWTAATARSGAPTLVATVPVGTACAVASQPSASVVVARELDQTMGRQGVFLFTVTF